ncbi:MAG: thermonuclease family protein [Nitrospirota bacterium]
MKNLILNVFYWFVGVVLLLIGLVQFSNTYYVSSILLVASALLILPVSKKYFFSKAGPKVFEYRVAITVGMLLLGFLSIGFNAEPENPIRDTVKGGRAVTEVTNLEEDDLPESVTESEGTFEVVNVVDGDTLDVMIEGNKVRIRLIGVDTPETVHPSKPVECFGQEASTFAKDTLSGKIVRLEIDDSQGNVDKYGRILRYVFLENDVNFNKMLIEEGYAFEYTYNLPYKYQVEFIEAEKQAELNGMGLWASGVCDYGEEAEVVVAPTPEPEPMPETSSYSCSVSKNCGDMTSCDEAYYYLHTCGKGGLDRDKDGVPCESLCN